MIPCYHRAKRRTQKKWRARVAGLGRRYEVWSRGLHGAPTGKALADRLATSTATAARDWRAYLAAYRQTIRVEWRVVGSPTAIFREEP